MYFEQPTLLLDLPAPLTLFVRGQAIRAQVDRQRHVWLHVCGLQRPYALRRTRRRHRANRQVNSAIMPTRYNWPARYNLPTVIWWYVFLCAIGLRALGLRARYGYGVY